MKKILAILLTLAMVISMAVTVSAGNISSVDVGTPQKTNDNKNIAFKLPTAMAGGETAVIHITGTTDTDFRIWLGSLYNAASNIAYMIKDGNDFDLTAELTTTGEATTVTLKTVNSWDSNASANSLSTLEGVTVTTLEVFYGTMDEYNAISEQPTSNPTYTGYFSTGDDTHALIIGDAIITSNHEFNANGNCIYCGFHKDIEEEEVVIETPVESTEEEVDTDDTDEVEEPTEADENPTTGIALALLPVTAAAAVVVISKRK